ncbi:MAG: cadherin repeat domain-containing protein [Actinomycetia bacterium]|nr:cadherin repeat domain-containing protein [Actinomycetes bacterium]
MLATCKRTVTLVTEPWQHPDTGKDPTPEPEPEPAPNRPPVLVAFTLQVPENTAAGSAVGDPVIATDPDGDTLTYAISAGSFTIDAATGQITVATGAILDYETRAFYTVTVTVTDSRGGFAHARGTITITDVGEPRSQPDPPPRAGGGPYSSCEAAQAAGEPRVQGAGAAGADTPSTSFRRHATRTVTGSSANAS